MKFLVYGNLVLLRTFNWFDYILTWTMMWLIMISWSSNSLIFIWLMMEFTFILFLGKNVPSMFYNFDYSSFLIKYYLNQVLYSVILLFGFLSGFLSGSFFDSNSEFFFVFIMFALLAKLGFFPFHLWMISLIGKMDWLNYFLLMSIMKLIPFFMYLCIFNDNITFLLFSGLAGSILGANNLCLQKILGYSSMINFVWLMLSFILSSEIGFFFFFFYFLMLFILCFFLDHSGSYYVNQLKLTTTNHFKKLNLIVIMLSLAGYPPFMGFFLKWLVVVLGLSVDLSLVLGIMVFSAVLVIYFYLQMIFYFYMIYHCTIKWFMLFFFRSPLGMIDFFSFLVFFLFMFCWLI